MEILIITAIAAFAFGVWVGYTMWKESELWRNHSVQDVFIGKGWMMVWATSSWRAWGSTSGSMPCERKCVTDDWNKHDILYTHDNIFPAVKRTQAREGEQLVILFILVKFNGTPAHCWQGFFSARWRIVPTSDNPPKNNTSALRHQTSLGKPTTTFLTIQGGTFISIKGCTLYSIIVY